MTKFEEELFNKVPCKFELTTEAEYKKSTLINHFKNWHSDEEFQELLEQNAELTRENNIVNQINSKLESQIIGLKSQLQQQALPVVPDFVAEWYEEHKDDLDYSIYSLCEEFDDTEPNREPTEFESWFDIVSNQPILTLVGMRNGYTVEKPQLEKPQLFYLKNKLTGKYLRSYTGLSMDDTTLRYEEVKDERVGGFGGGTTFTQLEIDSMQTGSYELVPVEDGE